MKIKSLLLLCLIVFSFSTTKANSLNSDSLNNIVKAEKLKNEALLADIKALEIQITKHEINENYFQSSIESMIGIFSVICGGFFILFGLITYAGFRKEVNQIKKESIDALKQQKEEFESFNKSVSDIEDNLMHQSARTNVLIANFLEQDEMFVSQLAYNFRASLLFAKLGDQTKGCKANLQVVLKTFKKISMNDKLKEDVKSESSDLIKLIDELSGIKNINDDVRDLLAEFRLSLKNYIK